MFHKGIVLFGRTFGQWLKPVGVVCGTLFHGPAFHTFRHLIGRSPVKSSSVIHCIYQLVEYGSRKIFEHLLAVENMFREVFVRTFRRSLYFDWLSRKSLFYYAKS